MPTSLTRRVKPGRGLTQARFTGNVEFREAGADEREAQFGDAWMSSSSPA